MAIPLKSEKLRERQHQRVAFLLTFFMNVALLAMLYFMKIYFEEENPLFEYGMEVSYGQDDRGSGNTPVPIEEIRSNPAPTEATESEQSDPVPTQTENIETVDAPTPPIPQPKPDQSNASEKSQPDPLPPKDPAPKKVQSDKATQNTPGQGDDPGEKGNKGKETGINEQGLYKGGGGKGGTSLSVSGWKWEEAPNVQDQSSKTGKIIFVVKVDDQGNFLTVKALYPGTTVADRRVVEKYRMAVLNSYLEPDETAGENPAPISQGTVTFTLTAR